MGYYTRRLCKVFNYVYGIDISIAANSSNKTNQEILEAIQYYDTQIVREGLTIKTGNSSYLDLTKEISSEIKNNTTVRILITFNGVFEDLLVESHSYDGGYSETEEEKEVDEVECQVNNEAIVDYLHSKFDGKFEDIQLIVSCGEVDYGQCGYKSKDDSSVWDDKWRTAPRLPGYDFISPEFRVTDWDVKPILTAFLNSNERLAIENAKRQYIYFPKQSCIYIPKDTTIFNIKAVYRITPEYIALTNDNKKMKSIKKSYIQEIIESDVINQINDYNITNKNEKYIQITNYNVDLVSGLITLQMKYEPYREFDIDDFGDRRYYENDDLYKCSCILNNVKVNDTKILQHWYKKTSTDVVPNVILQFNLKLEYFVKINNIDQTHI